MIIYPDVIFLENMVMNYLIIYLTAKFTKTKPSHLRILLGSLIGAAYVMVIIFLPDIKIYYSVPAKILLSLFIVAIVFSPDKAGKFIKMLAVFYISSFIFAGAAFAFIFFKLGGGFIYNGMFYFAFKSNWTMVLLSSIAVGIIVRVIWEVFQNRLVKDQLYKRLKIAFDNKTADMDALVDTGNSLHDPLSNLPVVVVEFKALRDILPTEINSIFERSHDNDIVSAAKIISSSSWFSRFRLIPFTSLGRENGMLIGFKPDYIIITENDGSKGINDVIVGIYNSTLSKNDRYKALLSPELI